MSRLSPLERLSLVLLATLFAMPQSAAQVVLKGDPTYTNGYAIPAAGTSMTVRYHLHLVREAGGTSVLAASEVDALLARMASEFAPSHISFLEVGRDSVDNAGSLALFQTYSRPDAIDVFLEEMAAGCGSGGQGDDPYPAAAEGLAEGTPGTAFHLEYRRAGTCVQSTSEPGTGAHTQQDEDAMVELAHEMGHALGLFHTFHGTVPENNDPVQCPEPPDGSDGYECGDYVADTPADPSGRTGWSGCTFTGGGGYAPLASNIMAYSPVGCRTQFTPGQASRMFTVTLLQNAEVVESATLPASLPIPVGYATRLKNATLTMAIGTRIEVDGGLYAESVVFTAASAAQGWNGIRFESGSGGTIAGGTIERVGGWNNAAVTITDAVVSLSGATVSRPPTSNGSGVRGIRVTGPSSNVTLREVDIRETTYGALAVDNRAFVRMQANTFSMNTGPYGVGTANTVSFGYDTDAFLHPLTPTGTTGNHIFNNGGNNLSTVAVSAHSSAHVVFGAYYHATWSNPNHGFNFITDNDGVGLSAGSGVLLDAGGDLQIGKRYNSFADNDGVDAQAGGTAARVLSACDWWGVDAPPFDTQASSGGTVSVGYWLTQDPQVVGASAACTSSGGGAGMGEPMVSADGQAKSSRDLTPAGRLRVAEALQGRARLTALDAVLAAGPRTPEAAAAVVAAARMAARYDTAPDVAVDADVFVAAIAADPLHPAHRAGLVGLMGLRGRQGDPAGALAAADGLLALALADGESHPDAVAARYTRVYALAEIGRLREAAVALADLERAAPESGEAALARAHLADMAPDLSLAAPPAVVRLDAAGDEFTPAFEVGVPSPNPATDEVVVPLSFPDGVAVRVSVVDALGREVRTLSVVSRSSRAALDVADLATGPYIVVVTPSGGGMSVSRRFTVVR